MPADDQDDPGADTAMFRAYVDQPTQPEAPAQSRTVVVALVVGVLVLALVVVLALVA